MDEIDRTLEEVRSYEKRDSDAAVRRWAARRTLCEAQTQRVCRQGMVAAITGPVPAPLAVQHATTLLDRWKWRKAQVSAMIPHRKLTVCEVAVARELPRHECVFMSSLAARRASLHMSAACMTDSRVCVWRAPQTQSNIDTLDNKLKQLHESFAQGEVIDRWTPGVVVPFKQA